MSTPKTTDRKNHEESNSSGSDEYLSDDSTIKDSHDENENMEELRESLAKTQKELDELKKKGSEARVVEAHSVTELKMQQFYENDPELWFVTIEAQFEARKITSDKTKYNSVVMNLNYKAASQVKSTLQTEYKDGKYKELKDALIEAFSATSTQRIKQLISNEQLGDQKPSQLLDKMRQLGGKSVTDEFIKNLWVQRLPETQRHILSASNDKIESLANMADRMWESANYSFVNAIDNESKVKSATLQSVSDQLEKICARLKDLESKNRQRDTSPQQQRTRSRSNSSKRNGNGDEMCWYHRTLGEAAKKCRTPCNYKQQQKN